MHRAGIPRGRKTCFDFDASLISSLTLRKLFTLGLNFWETTISNF